MSKKKKSQNTFAEARLVAIPYYDYGIDDLKKISKESNEEGLSLHADHHMYFSGRMLSEKQVKASYHLGSELPRFNMMFVLDADKPEMAKIYQIWKALTTLNSYILFDLDESKVMIALYTPNEQDSLEDMFNYHEYYFAKKLRVVQVGHDGHDQDMIEYMQEIFDVQFYNQHEGSQLFAHTLMLDEKKSMVMPIFIEYEIAGLKLFRFDQVA